MEIFIMVVGLLMIAGAGYRAYYNRQVVECLNCRIKLSRAQFRKNGGCLQCGTDLARPVKR